jgi:hypothetical protein
MPIAGMSGAVPPFSQCAFMAAQVQLYLTLPRNQDSLEWMYVHSVTNERTLTLVTGNTPCKKSRHKRCCVVCDPTVEVSPGGQGACLIRGCDCGLKESYLCLGRAGSKKGT